MDARRSYGAGTAVLMVAVALVAAYSALAFEREDRSRTDPPVSTVTAPTVATIALGDLAAELATALGVEPRQAERIVEVVSDDGGRVVVVVPTTAPPPPPPPSTTTTTTSTTSTTRPPAVLDVTPDQHADVFTPATGVGTVP